ncbi:facilitated trehalose transporter Tret1-like isoform X5 [Leptinotarsa decemlineata]|uniref:facilitated trehalose transporter Tret1-like isoform X5 n=1 Tax=Leptinotarsa decemlineata TaxID=7539 RepID=UPI003D30B955
MITFNQPGTCFNERKNFKYNIDLGATLKIMVINIFVPTVADLIPFGITTRRYGYTVNMGIFSTGSHSGWPSSSLPLLTSGNSTINMTTQEGSLLTSVTPLTVPLGCIITAVMMKSMGRKTLLLLCPIPLIASWLLIAMATSKIHLYIGRALGGFIDGAIFNVGPAYISEIADAEVRGLFGTSIMVIIHNAGLHTIHG